MATVLQRPNSLTPENIVGKLFSFHNSAHFLHLQTKSFAEHKALDEAYKDLVDSKDEITEYLLGIQAPKRLGQPFIDPLPTYDSTAMYDLGERIFEFSVKLCSYADEKNLEELCNLASELQQIGVKLKYFSTLK